MRLARIQFSRMVLMQGGGMTGSLFVSMFKSLPPDFRIVGMGEDHSFGTCHVFVTSDRFREIPEGSRPCDITAHFRRDYKDGVSVDSFEKLDMSDAIDQAQGCFHVWKEYHGAMDRFNYCEKCNQKESK